MIFLVSQISKACYFQAHCVLGTAWLTQSGSHQGLDVSVMSGHEKTLVHIEYMKAYDKLDGVNRGAKRVSKERTEEIS